METINERKQNLYFLLDENYERFYQEGEFWRKLHAIDKEIAPGSISMEDFDGRPAQHIVSGEDTSDIFCKGQPTLVIKLQGKQATVAAAKLLNAVFRGTGTVFIPESVDNDGQVIYQLRSNIDKRHWEKLCVFCAYRFDREIGPVGQKKLQQECQKIIDNYTRGSSSHGWEATEGIPAFCEIMGLHGNLRPSAKRRPDIHRKESELNDPHPRGTPVLFEGIVMHADIKRSGEITFTPYEIYFDVNRVAMSDATGGKSYGHLLLETCGGNPFDHVAPSRRVIKAIGLMLGTYGLFRGGTEVIGLIGPTASVVAAGVALAATYADHRYRLVDNLLTIKKKHNGHGVPRSVGHNRTLMLTEAQEEIPPEIRRVHQGDYELEVPPDVMRDRVWATIIRRMVNEGQLDAIQDGSLHARVKTDTTKLR